MFITLLVVTFLTAALVCTICIKVFGGPMDSTLGRIVAPEIATAWLRYMKFAIFVVGISGGVRIHELERFINPSMDENDPLALTTDRWVLEIYRTIVQSLEAIAGTLLVFFLFGLFAYGLVRATERAKPRRDTEATD